ncbi:hypothetical protein ANN_25271 [Periplaneta americana]|uniref:Per a allergen n=1 Tax=Periplaneta americana TaxID=6978 RepID=A0ABQ8S113_PERAM|nr:hypothetical protein ANN_25271 [Periplaneta americana]
MAGLCEGGNEPAGSLKAVRNGTSRVLSVASLHWLKMDVPIPAHAADEVRSVIKFLNAEGIAPIENDRQLCQVYGQADGALLL